VSDTVTPRSFSEVAAALAGAAAQGQPVRVSGGGTKLGWGSQTPAGALKLQMTHLNRVIVHADDAPTATLGAGTSIVRAQSLLARSGRMLAVDPYLGPGHEPAATVGGVVATADSGPLSHRYGPVRDQIVGVTLALSDGTVMRTGPRADGEEHGYELATLVTGAYGTLGIVLAVDVRLQPLPGMTATALGTTSDHAALRDAALHLRRTHPTLEALDVAWRGGQGGLLAQVAGDDAAERAASVSDAMRVAGLAGTTVRTDDAALWARQRAGQRSAERALLRIHSRPSALDRVLRIADATSATLVGRAALGVSYLTLNVNQIAVVRDQLPAGAAAVALDLPTSARGAVDPWALADGPELELMRQIKLRFDPADVCNPGIFVGGI
jgi:glycolate oxidase FAD binding subunit